MEKRNSPSYSSSMTGMHCFIALAFLQQFRNFFIKRINIFKLAMHRGIAHIRYLIEIFKQILTSSPIYCVVISFSNELRSADSTSATIFSISAMLTGLFSQARIRPFMIFSFEKGSLVLSFLITTRGIVSIASKVDAHYEMSVLRLSGK